MTNSALSTENSTLPDNLKEEVADFASLLKQKLNREKPSAPIKKRPFGIGKGSFVMSADFDESLEDFKEYMY